MADTSDTDQQDARSGSLDVLSVSDLNERIASVIEQSSQLHDIRCIGEVTDFHQNSTALYFTLTDGDAELPCMIWANRYQNMDVDIEDGMKVVLEGDIDYWVEGGKIDLKPWNITVVGEGDQAAAIDRLHAELKERGWFSDEHRQTPPVFPERIGVVTSLQGDARYDIQNAIHGNDPTVDILIQDAIVQGPKAPESIANGIHYLDRNEDVDAIIVGRGGGSDTDLMAFNRETVAEAIFTASTPIITAIGHTDDRFIADYVADLAAITPTRAGEYLAGSPEEYVEATVEPLEQGLESAYEVFEREHKHEAELAEAVAEAEGTGGISPVYYKITITVLLVLLLIVLGLWLGVV
jgi:exodeoxyribonuclease VII large subunit